MATSTRRRVVITGLGVVTPLGLDGASYWQSLVEGRSGVKPIKSFDCSPLPTRFAGEIPDFDAKQFIDKKDRKNLRNMARGIQLAVAAAQRALDDSKVDKARLDPTRFGVEFGAGLLPSELTELGPASKLSFNGQTHQVDLKIWGEQGLKEIWPLWMLKYLPNMLACHVSILHNAQGPNNSITEGDVASLLALAESYRILRRNQADFFLVGGGDSKINPLSLTRQCLFGRLSQNNEAPEKACRPFDRRRDGSVLGEGAGVLVLEDLDHALRREAPIYAEVVGVGAAFDRGCKGAGLARAIKAALMQAEIQADDLDHVNAHGLGYQQADAWEARGLQEGLAAWRRPIPVLAVKSYMGNLGAGSGLSEMAASLLAMKHGQLPATLNYEEPDPACPVHVNRANQPVTRPHFLKVGFTDMGQCAAVVCRKWEE